MTHSPHRPRRRAQARQPDLPGLSGVARVDRRTKDLTKRLRAGEIALIDHVDLDGPAAEALLACKPAAVVNAAKSLSGRYPAMGLEILLAAGIPVVDEVGPAVLERICEGDMVRLDGNVILRGSTPVAVGKAVDLDEVVEALAEARSTVSEQIEAFAANTMEYLRAERDLLFDGVGVPDITTELDGRHVLMVVRGTHHKDDLAVLRPYIREYRPVCIGVDGGADALLEGGHKPDIIVGDMDSVSDAALGCGAELIVHAYPDGTAPGLDRVTALGLPCVLFPAAGTSEDVAMLLADDKGASLIVAVGSHTNLVEFLEKGRGGMASTFLTRLRVGGKLVDAKGVSRLYRSRISNASLAALVLAALTTIIATLLVSPAGKGYLTVLGSLWDDFVFWLRSSFS
ncbi:putative cytokinetic ring protein SteA [Catenulispora rubra]|uniref:putative cytokinetic ring protein SteA n=1 Tax=Catenulispora rubra TaxID=280293 RepID=UPI0018924065|nr:putative cytokinetic ring protein SteA [Catenulispora rubra]